MAATNIGADTAPLSDAEARNSETVRQMVAYLSSHNVAGMLACFDPEMEWLDVPMEASYRGHSEISVFLDSLFDAFPDLDYQLTHMVTRGDSVVAQFRMRGTHQNTFYGLPATQATVEIPCLSMITMRNGKMLSDHCYFDNAMILRQMGLMPPLSVTLSPPGRAFLWAAVKGKQTAPLLGVAVVGWFALSRLFRRKRD
ncbi:MAG TPA: nuclear transport factor 2 family protein [Chloroflexota bacterium]|nr:nuclear transport factor 2 family protein [Chloroflexota bacterium]